MIEPREFSSLELNGAHKEDYRIITHAARRPPLLLPLVKCAACSALVCMCDAESNALKLAGVPLYLARMRGSSLAPILNCGSEKISSKLSSLLPSA